MKKFDMQIWRALVENGCSGGVRQVMKTPGEGAMQGRWIGAASGRRQTMQIVTVVVILCLVAGLRLAFWGLAEPRTTAALVEGKLPSVSYNRFAKPSSADLAVSEAQIRADLTAIAK